MQELTVKITGVHQACGFDTDARDPDPLQMLSAIEARMEELFATIAGAEEEGGDGMGVNSIVSILSRTTHSAPKYQLDPNVNFYSPSILQPTTQNIRSRTRRPSRA